MEKIEYIFNPDHYRMFLGQLGTVENCQMESAFQSKLGMENSPKERQLVLDRLDTLCQQVSHNRRRARIVRMWHGYRKNILLNLLSDGFATLGFLDDGW
ncbi:unnamed protein product [Rotaria magnacalcarata]|uniref:Uncharacterized protein n=1 Tax=Rotaria magnacalcarata TaxID=392030 RepID=A0A819TDJ5_9BILA|nr:unnamed protein product [Rotaria magnacalcarata]CAF2051296.1 unnamed protein product [Rotaria magnacalcarata]CAF4056546.1 unnamed protein product [Rotaria magnacalcarata]CAF4079899.1 unnamed protein product [Rotaria magnacalcarata]